MSIQINIWISCYDRTNVQWRKSTGSRLFWVSTLCLRYYIFLNHSFWVESHADYWHRIRLRWTIDIDSVSSFSMNQRKRLRQKHIFTLWRYWSKFIDAVCQTFGNGLHQFYEKKTESVFEQWSITIKRVELSENILRIVQKCHIY